MMKNLQLQVKLSAIDKLTAPFKNTMKATKELSSAFSKNKKILEQLKKSREKIANLRMTGAEERLKKRIEQTTQAIDKQRIALEKLNKIKARQQAYRSSVEKLKNNSQRLQNIGQRAMLTGGAFTGTAGLMLKPAVDFEQSFSKVQALTRLDKNNAEDAFKIKALRDQAINLGATTSFTSTDVAEGQGYLAMAGFKDNQILKSMPSILNMTKAAGMEMGRVADISSDILSGFKKSANDMTSVSDVLTLTFTTSNTNLELLGDSMKYVGPIATKTGQDFETMAAMVGLLGNVGIKGSQAGTSLRAMLNRLSGPPTRAAKALKKLNVQTKDAKGNLRPITDILADIAEKSKKYGNADQMEFFKNIFGEEAATAAAELITQSGEKGIRTYAEMLKNASGTASKVAETMTDNLMGDLKNLESAREAIGISVYDSTSKELRKLTQNITGVLRKINEWVKANPELTAKIVKWGGILAGSLTIIGALSMGMSFLLYPVARLILGFSYFTGITGKLNKGLKNKARYLNSTNKSLFSYKGTLASLAKVKKFFISKFYYLIRLFKKSPHFFFNLIKSMKKLSFWFNLLKTVVRVALSPIKFLLMGIGTALSFILSPIGLLVTGLVAGAVLIYKYWDQVKAFFTGFWEGLKTGLTPVLEKFKPLGDAFGVVVDWLEKAVKWFTDLLSPVQSASEDLEKARKAGESFGENVSKAIEFILKPLTTVIDLMKWVIDNASKVNPFSDENLKNVPKIEHLKDNAPYQQRAGNLSTAINTTSSYGPILTQGKATGGYAGNGGRFTPKGIYHGGEFIFNKAATSRLGIGFLTTLHNAKSARAGMLAAGLSASVTAQPLKMDTRPPLSVNSNTSTAAPMNVNITINTSANQNAEDIARAVQRELARIENQRQARNRSRLTDRD
ncbi:TPA: phage tail tape measure protein [Pasteurella multocida]|nr:phage tail tape measure protein [Pasteurella multocida]